MDPAHRRVRWMVAVSMVVHAAAGVALLVYSFWKIERLSYKDKSLLSMPGVLGLPPGEPPPAPGTPKPAPTKQAKAPPDALSQPTKDPAPTDPASAPTEVASSTPSSSDQGGDGPPGGEGLLPGNGTGGGDPLAGPIDIPVVVAPPAVTPPPPPVAARQEQVEALRIAGDPRVLLPGSLLASLKAQGLTQFSVKVKVCLDERGVPNGQQITQSSENAEVDALVVRGTQSWRFRPFEVQGTPVPACFIAIFNYRIL